MSGAGLRRLRRGVAAGVLAAWIGTTWAADPAAGRTKAGACEACHGADGLGVQPNVPNLAGQPEIYLAEQLRLYRGGKRVHEVMNVVAKPLADRDIDDLAAWFASIRVQAQVPK